MINAGSEPAAFVIQDVDARPWRLIVDTSRSAPEDIRIDDPLPLAHPSWVVEGRAVVVVCAVDRAPAEVAP